MGKKAIIIGMGQDGYFMKELLLSKGYDITEVTRLNIIQIASLINSKEPDEIYNFAAISDVINPFDYAFDISDTNARLPHKILATILRLNKGIKFFQASSALIFGRDASGYQSETTPFNPLYPYGCAKLYAHNMVSEFREQGLFACSGIFFSHESERRKEHFFSRKITKAAATGSKVTVSNLSAFRDYGYAKDYVEAAYLMMQADTPTDYCIGTGKLISIERFAQKAFSYAGLNYKNYVEVNEQTRNEPVLRANITKIKTELGWQPTTSIDEMIKIMVDYDRTI